MNGRLRAGLIAGTLVLTIGLPAASALAEDTRPELTDVFAPQAVPPEGAAPSNSYIILSKQTMELQAGSPTMEERARNVITEARQDGVKPYYVYPSFGGFAAQLTAEQLQKLQADPSVTVRPDRDIYLEGFGPEAQNTELQGNRTRNLVRTSIKVVNDGNIDEVIQSSNGDNLVILEYAAIKDYAFHSMARSVAFMDNDDWTFGMISLRASGAIAKMAELYGSSNSPAMVALRNGQVVGKYTGGASSRTIQAWINEMKKTQPGPTPDPTTAPPTEEPTTAPPTEEPTETPTVKPPTTKPPTNTPTVKPPTTKPPTNTPTVKPPTTKPPTNTPTVKPPTTKPPTNDPTAGPVPPQKNAPWNLDLIDNRDGKTDGQYAPINYGKGTTIYVMDTGVTATHNDFGGRVTAGYSAFPDLKATDDDQGHGTHVASIAAGKSWGVAKEANIVAVKVFNSKGAGKESGWTGAIDYIVKNAKRGSVVNASWYDPKSATSSHDLVAPIIKAGIPWVNAAGNDNMDACKGSPSSEKDLIVVGATNKKMAFDTAYSNFGTCVDINAPGTDIKAAQNNTTSGAVVKSGTSMAAPHVAGGVAVYLANHMDAKLPDVHQAMIDWSSKDILSSIGKGTPNRFLYVGAER